MTEKYTYRKLRQYLENLTEEELNQEVIIGTDDGYFYDCLIDKSTQAIFKPKGVDRPMPEEVLDEDAIEDHEREDYEMLYPSGRVFLSY